MQKLKKGFTPFRNQGKNRRFLTGFTLIEILIATGILVMVGVGVIVVEKQFMGAGSAGKHRLQATALAQEGINQVKAKYNANLLNTAVVDDDKMKIVNGTPGQLPEASKTYVLKPDGTLCEQNEGTCGDGKITQNNVEFTRTITFPAN